MNWPSGEFAFETFSFDYCFRLQNNMNYAVCIKRQPNTCSVTYTNEVDESEYDFQLINVDSGRTSERFVRSGNVCVCENCVSLVFRWHQRDSGENGWSGNIQLSR